MCTFHIILSAYYYYKCVRDLAVALKHIIIIIIMYYYYRILLFLRYFIFFI